MDETQIYITMCDCPEVQGQRSKEGIEIACWVTRYLYISKSFDYWTMVKAPHVWLPRQDQIQEMMGYSNPVLAMEPLAIYRSSNQWNHFKTWEQLWLAFYMHEKHGRTWDGKEWVAEEIMTTTNKR